MSRIPATSQASSPRATRAQRKLSRRTGRERGAVMVEALIVISLLILCFLGIEFFREFYTRTLVASRLARGSILVYSMTGCGSNNEPAQWLGRPDLANFSAARPNANSQPASGTGNNANASASGEAGSVLDRIPGLSGDGSGILNPMTTSDLSGRVRARTSSGALAPERTIFNSEVRARSFVSCGDPIRDGDFADVMAYIQGIFL